MLAGKYAEAYYVWFYLFMEHHNELWCYSESIFEPINSRESVMKIKPYKPEFRLTQCFSMVNNKSNSVNQSTSVDFQNRSLC